MPLLLIRVAIVFFILASYPIAQFLPVHAGWENGFIESLQLSFLFMGVTSAFYFAYNESRLQWRWFALMLIPIWFLIIGREMSWGATLLASPSSINPELGPVYSSSLLHGFKPVTRVIAILMLFSSAFIFVMKKQYSSVWQLYKHKMMPGFELGLAFIAFVLCNVAEGRGGVFEVMLLSQGHMQTLEELFEMWVYLLIFIAQIRVFNQLSKNSELHKKATFS